MAAALALAAMANEVMTEWRIFALARALAAMANELMTEWRIFALQGSGLRSKGWWFWEESWCETDKQTRVGTPALRLTDVTPQQDTGYGV